MENDEKQDDFRPRLYQEQLMNLAKMQNTIIYLPTGSGKTFIAVMLIKEMSGSLDKGKHTFFMVNTVALVNQQAAYIRRHSHRSVGEYSGDLNVDLWTREQWQEELLHHQIMVMTCQIFLNLLLHGYVQLSEVNLLIFDECHHAVNDQPMRQVMQQFEHCPPELRPRVLGLTANLLNGNCKPERVDEEVRTLETTFLSKVATCENMPLVDRYSTNPIERVIKYNTERNTSGLSVLEKGLKLVENIQEFVQSIQFELDEVVPPHERPPNTVLMNTSQGKMNEKLKNLLTDVIFHIEMLGMFGGSQTCLAHIIQFERMRNKAQDSLTKNMFMALITTLVAVRKLFEDEMSDCVVKSQIHKYSSYKVLTLLEVLKTEMPKETVDDGSGGSVNELSDDYVSHILAHEKKEKMKPCAIVFVERRFTAKVLFLVLKALKEADSDFDYISPDFIVGFNNNPFNDTREGALENKWNGDSIKRFLSGHTNVLVASEVLEEGIDIQKCNLVVNFDMPKNYPSYVQSKGRARHRSSKYIIMVPCSTTGSSFKAKYDAYKATENALQNLLVGRTEGHEDPDNQEIAAELVDHLHDIPQYARQNLKLASDRMKTRYDKLANSAGYQEGDMVWFYRPIRTKGKSPKLQSSWEGPYKVVNRINDVMYRIQKNPRSRMLVVHLDRLATYQGAARDELN
jgi:endoribonuclease Dicer